jgi:hypothetical protein
MSTAAQKANIEALHNALKSRGICRPFNPIEGKVERVDRCFSYLTEVYFSNPKEFKLLSQSLSLVLKRPINEFGWALRGYFSYLKEDYKDAAASFIEAIVMAPYNLDNWLDYAFALRHLGLHQASLKIMFQTKTIMKSVVAAPVEIRKARLLQKLKI